MEYNQNNDNEHMNKNEIDKILNNEILHGNNKIKTWSRIDKANKIKKLNDYAELYGKKHNLTIDRVKLLKGFLRQCIDKKRLVNIKDVSYDKDSEIITDIPSLILNQNKKFTLKRCEKRVSTLKSLSIPNKNKTIDSKEEEK